MEFQVRRRRRPPKPKWPKYVLIGLALVICVALVIILGSGSSSDGAGESEKQNRIVVEISLNGGESLTLEYGESYSESGATAFWYETKDPDQRHELPVEIVNNADITSVGEYTISYSARYEDVSAEKVRVVRVVDTQAPVIELVNNPDGYTLPNQKYQEEGFKATDNYDGDITDKVVRVESEDGATVTYTVTDSSGNQTQVVRTIVYDDREAPVLTLKGESKITITAGNGWSDPGYSAKDAVDGDLTQKVKVSGKVDHRTAGIYTIEYSVTDSHNNTAKIKRVVVVNAVSKPEVVEPDGEGKVIYLTFDDGPSKHTERLLQILDKYDVKVTFFVCNSGRLDLLDDMVAAGHSVGIHSMTHQYSDIYSSDDAFFKDFNAVRDLIERYSGVAPTLSRFPGGSSNRVSQKYNKGIMTRLTQAVQDLGYQYVDWNIDSDDAGSTKTTEGVFRNVTQGIAKSKRDHFVVLQHDTYGYSVDAVEQIIQWGLKNGYTFQALDLTSPVCHHSLTN